MSADSWIGRDKLRFKADWEADMTVADLATKYGRSEAAIKRARVRFGLEPRVIGPGAIIRVRLPKHMDSRLHALAEKRNISVSALVRQALEELLTPV